MRFGEFIKMLRKIDEIRTIVNALSDGRIGYCGVQFIQQILRWDWMIPESSVRAMLYLNCAIAGSHFRSTVKNRLEWTFAAFKTRPASTINDPIDIRQSTIALNAAQLDSQSNERKKNKMSKNKTEPKKNNIIRCECKPNRAKPNKTHRTTKWTPSKQQYKLEQ